jgi:hypothetical protein
MLPRLTQCPSSRVHGAHHTDSSTTRTVEHTTLTAAPTPSTHALCSVLHRWLRNIQLAGYSSIVALLTLLCQNDPALAANGWFHNFGFNAWLSVRRLGSHRPRPPTPWHALFSLMALH